MKTIVCLGNPGTEYDKTRHNIGFNIGREIVKEANLIIKEKKFKSILFKGQWEDEDVQIVFPQTYMNNSGQTVQLIKGFYKLHAKDFLVIYDDIDIPLGKIRIREKGSAGTHNGMKSIIKEIKTNDFPRIRLGIGPKDERIPLQNFVLGKFSNEELEVISDYAVKSGNILKSWLKNGIQKAMNEHN